MFLATELHIASIALRVTGVRLIGTVVRTRTQEDPMPGPSLALFSNYQLSGCVEAALPVVVAPKPMTITGPIIVA